MLGVSETALRRTSEYSLAIGEDTYTTISDTELDNTISSMFKLFAKLWRKNGHWSTISV